MEASVAVLVILAIMSSQGFKYFFNLRKADRASGE